MLSTCCLNDTCYLDLVWFCLGWSGFVWSCLIMSDLVWLVVVHVLSQPSHCVVVEHDKPRQSSFFIVISNLSASSADPLFASPLSFGQRKGEQKINTKSNHKKGKLETAKKGDGSKPNQKRYSGSDAGNGSSFARAKRIVTD